MKIALLQCPMWGVYDPPVALAQLSSCLKQDGFTVRCFDLNLELYNNRKDSYKTIWAMEQTGFWCNPNNVEEFFRSNIKEIEKYLQALLDFDPKVIAFSVNVASRHATCEFARIIKQKNPGIRIVIGGPLFLVPSDIEEILRLSPFDIIVLGEGEETFVELLNKLENNQELSQCPGIAFKQNGETVKTSPRKSIEHLDRLPFLDLTDFPLNRYDPPGHLGKHISLMASRGCIQNCVFCGPRAYWQGYRYMSGIRIYEEIKYHLKNHPEIEHIEFLDLLINGNISTLDKFCELMIIHPPKKNLRWHANAVIRPEMSLELCKKMKKAGCAHLTFGIESGSQKVLALMRKRYNIKDADQVLKNTHDAGISVTCNFMFGFPGESEVDFQQTLTFLKNNSSSIDTAYPSRSFCTIEPYSYLEKNLDKFNIIPNPVNNTFWESSDGKNNYPERLRRCEAFSDLAASLGVEVGLGLQTSIELDRCYNLGNYYESKKNYAKALEYFLRYLELDPANKTIIDKAKRFKSYCCDGNLR